MPLREETCIRLQQKAVELFAEIVKNEFEAKQKDAIKMELKRLLKNIAGVEENNTDSEKKLLNRLEKVENLLPVLKEKGKECSEKLKESLWELLQERSESTKKLG